MHSAVQKKGCVSVFCSQQNARRFEALYLLVLRSAHEQGKSREEPHLHGVAEQRAQSGATPSGALEQQAATVLTGAAP